MHSDRAESNRNPISVDQRPETPLETVERRINGTRRAINDLTGELHGHADEVFGPRPPTGIEGVKEPDRPGRLVSIEHELNMLETSVASLGDAVKRFSNLG